MTVVAPAKPKAFISYSWTSEEHRLRVKGWAEQLISDGVEVTLDIFDLKEGQDKYAFMERMITDPSVTHVLVFSDRVYAEKANSRRSGVGTESQIISKEVYDKIEQSKFIPLVCEFDAGGNAYLPAFFQTRIYIDFSSAEAANQNWEQLVRLLYGKPQYEKPQLGKPPAYVLEPASTPASPAISKFNTLRGALMSGKPGLAMYRTDFLNAVISYADTLRIRTSPKQQNVPELGAQILEDFSKLKAARNYLVDWILLEASAAPSTDFDSNVLTLLEQLLELKARPEEMNQWNDAWFGAHQLFVYDFFLYLVAALLKCSAFGTLNEVYKSHYLSAKSQRHRDAPFETFESFYGYSEVIGPALSTQHNYYSPAAELIRRSADRADLTFDAVMEAELLTFMMALISGKRWYPGTLLYGRYTRDFPVFLRATQHKGFRNLATITGIDSADVLRERIKKGLEGMNANFRFRFDRDFWESMRAAHFDTLT